MSQDQSSHAARLFRLTVKGTPDQAKAAVVGMLRQERGVAVVAESPECKQTHLDVMTDDYHSLTQWYCEGISTNPPHHAPFPVGTLLFFSEVGQA